MASGSNPIGSSSPSFPSYPGLQSTTDSSSDTGIGALGATPTLPAAGAPAGSSATGSSSQAQQLQSLINQGVSDSGGSGASPNIAQSASTPFARDVFGSGSAAIPSSYGAASSISLPQAPGSVAPAPINPALNAPQDNSFSMPPVPVTGAPDPSMLTGGTDPSSGLDGAAADAKTSSAGGLSSLKFIQGANALQATLAGKSNPNTLKELGQSVQKAGSKIPGRIGAQLSSNGIRLEDAGKAVDKRLLSENYLARQGAKSTAQADAASAVSLAKTLPKEEFATAKTAALHTLEENKAGKAEVVKLLKERSDLIKEAADHPEKSAELAGKIKASAEAIANKVDGLTGATANWAGQAEKVHELEQIIAKGGPAGETAKAELGAARSHLTQLEKAEKAEIKVVEHAWKAGARAQQGLFGFAKRVLKNPIKLMRGGKLAKFAKNALPWLGPIAGAISGVQDAIKAVPIIMKNPFSAKSFYAAGAVVADAVSVVMPESALVSTGVSMFLEHERDVSK